MICVAPFVGGIHGYVHIPYNNSYPHGYQLFDITNDPTEHHDYVSDALVCGVFVCGREGQAQSAIETETPISLSPSVFPFFSPLPFPFFSPLPLPFHREGLSGLFETENQREGVRERETTRERTRERGSEGDGEKNLRLLVISHTPTGTQWRAL